MNAQPAQVSWHERARALTFRTQAFIDGRYADAASGATFESINPATSWRASLPAMRRTSTAR